MAERISDLLIDEILESAKSYNNSQDTTKEYSAEDIDRLIADISGDTGSPAEKKQERSEPLKTVKIAEKKNEKAEKPKFKLNIPKTKESDDGEEISLMVEESGQVGIASGGVEIGVETPAENVPEQQEKKEVKSVSGQISIEKTRLFNEVKIRGEYNPNISHNLGNKVARTTTGEAEPLASPVMGEEKYRKHFMNRPAQSLEKTQEHRRALDSLPQKTIETPGVVVKKGEGYMENTDGVQPLPKIISAEYELQQEKTRIDLPKINLQDIVAENQIMLEGFDDDDAPIQQSEEQAEEELRINRREAVDEFVNGGLLFKQEVEEPSQRQRFDRQSVHVAREYFGPKDKAPVRKILTDEKKRLVVKAVALSVICLVMSVLSAVAGAENGNFELYGNNEIIYVAFQLVLLLVACAVSFKSFIGAFKSIKNKTVNMDGIVTLSSLAGIIQCAVAFGFTDNVEATAHITAGAAVIPMILKTVGEIVRCKNDIDNFDFVSDENLNLHTVENIDDEETSTEIARGLMLGDPDIKYSAKTDFPARFVELSRSAEVTGTLLKIATPAVFAIAVIAAIVCGGLTKNVFSAVSAFSGIVLMGLPVAAGLVSAKNLRAANNRLRSDGAVINGYSAVEDAVNSNGVVIDAQDAFLSGGCNIEGIKLYHKMRIDEAILYTASVIIASGGVLADIFDGVIVGKREILFPVETLAYEEKLGCSCWINNHRVLVGNRELLVHHNVDTPDKELEEKYRSQGRNVIYLAIEGKIAAMFVVVYKANEQTAKYMRQLEKDGLTIFFRTSDANITEEFVESEFGLPENVVKIINPVAGEMFAKIKNNVKERSDAKIIHDGSVKSMLKALHNAFLINSFVNISRIVQLVASLLGVVIVVLLTFMSGLVQVGVWQIIIYQILWATILSLLPEFRKS